MTARRRKGSRSARRGSSAPPPPRADHAYFFDIDGTLVEIAEHPAEVELDRDLRGLIRLLHRRTGGAVALISGRSISEVDRLFPETRLPAAGQHGIERRDARGRTFRHEFSGELLARAHDRLRGIVAKYPGLMLEDKGLSVALHYRQAPHLAGYSHWLLRSMLSEVGPAFTIQTGKRVVELKPAGMDKGVAVMEFMNEKPFAGRLPVFVGDDRTDEFGFAMVNEMGGHSMKVGAGPTAATWRLRGVGAVRSWLESGLEVAVNEENSH